MIIFKSEKELAKYLLRQKSFEKKIGFVPTMGALHDGHLSLIFAAKKAQELCVCSIFVNPHQFNNKNDFIRYPITIEKDIEYLIKAGCDILFLPHQSEIYPKSFQAKHYDLGNLEQVLEGKFRPGHFQGVCQVVDRLLEIVVPDKLYLGQKDYQQCMVIKRLLDLTNRNKKVALHIAPTIREKSGLAMSSRNLRLSKEQLYKAVFISKALFFIKDHLAQLSIEQLKQKAEEDLREQGLEVDYIEIVNAETLKSASNVNQPLVVLAAAYVGDVRLIDNLVLN